MLKGVKRYTGFDEYAISEFFATDEEQPESAPSVRTERDGALDLSVAAVGARQSVIHGSDTRKRGNNGNR